MEVINMETRVAIISIIVEEGSATDEVNAVLHEFNSIIIGRMGIPYGLKNVNIISVVLDAPAEKINSLSGKLGMISGVSSKVLTAK